MPSPLLQEVEGYETTSSSIEMSLEILGVESLPRGVSLGFIEGPGRESPLKSDNLGPGEKGREREVWGLYDDLP